MSSLKRVVYQKGKPLRLETTVSTLFTVGVSTSNYMVMGRFSFLYY